MLSASHDSVAVPSGKSFAVAGRPRFDACAMRQHLSVTFTCLSVALVVATNHPKLDAAKQADTPKRKRK